MTTLNTISITTILRHIYENKYIYVSYALSADPGDHN